MLNTGSLTASCLRPVRNESFWERHFEVCAILRILSVFHVVLFRLLAQSS